MVILILGLVLFLGVHSVRIVADDWRTAKRAQLGEAKWKAAYSVLSLLGFILIVWGFGQARQQPVVLWTPPLAMRHVAGLLTAVAFILLTAKDIPRNGIKARVHHPMVLGVKVWALAHLLANGKLHDVVLFGSFLLWAILNFRAARRRDLAQGTVYPAGTTGATVTTVVAGLAGWAVFAFLLHGWLIGVRPF
ncbi:NnrU family protein [Duganella sp. LX20W]|uniref:NnrU family protein n=1 Tax=Rugamonas brunnea TaxID=2758569 RepID=A0A7W2EUA1_9BURK|nr:NnrU family protein [Rugamonas brunnea]MBA5638719.1 NnrU family protein [Rugamonas brunnea]